MQAADTKAPPYSAGSSDVTAAQGWNMSSPSFSLSLSPFAFYHFLRNNASLSLATLSCHMCTSAEYLHSCDIHLLECNCVQLNCSKIFRVCRNFEREPRQERLLSPLDMFAPRCTCNSMEARRQAFQTQSTTSCKHSLPCTASVNRPSSARYRAGLHIQCRKVRPSQQSCQQLSAALNMVVRELLAYKTPQSSRT